MCAIRLRVLPMTNELTIRRAGPAEAPALSRLASLAKASWGYPSEWLAAWESDLTLTPEYVEAHRTFVASLDGRVVGVLVLEEHGDHWSLEHVWVSPDAQGLGIGRGLVAHALATAWLVRHMRVEVVSDPNAEPFYRKLGARRIGARPAPMPGAPDRALPVLEFVPVPANVGA